jgi:acetyl esterase/lipase
MTQKTNVTYPNPEPVQVFTSPGESKVPRTKPQALLEQHCNVVYAETRGMGLIMDVFRSPSRSNGLGLIDVVSQAWQSGRERLNGHIAMGVMDVLCEEGFTIFALSPGSAEEFTGQEMVAHVYAGIRYIKDRAHDFGIDPVRLGLTGFSAGGHLAALAALAPQPATRHPKRPTTDVAAVGLFFPISDLTAFGPSDFGPRATATFPDALLFHDGSATQNEQSIIGRLAELSPALHVPANPPPFMLIHGTADEVVPCAQSEAFAASLRAAGGAVSLITKKDGGHPWPNVRPELGELGVWFTQVLQ